MALRGQPGARSKWGVFVDSQGCQGVTTMLRVTPFGPYGGLTWDFLRRDRDERCRLGLGGSALMSSRVRIAKKRLPSAWKPWEQRPVLQTSSMSSS